MAKNSEEEATLPRPVVVSREELVSALFADDRRLLDPSLPWSLVMASRLFSTSGSITGGSWVVNDALSPSAVAHAIPAWAAAASSSGGGSKTAASREGKGRVYLFSNFGPNQDEDGAVAARVAALAARIATSFPPGEMEDVKVRPSASAGRSSVMFCALDQRLLSSIRSEMSLSNSMEMAHTSQCGLFVLQGKNMGSNCCYPPRPPPTLRDGATVCHLTVGDAELVNSRWEYRSGDSIYQIQNMIAASLKEEDNGGAGGLGKGGCLGVKEDGDLVAWVLRYLDGSLGMVWTEEGYRRKGYASALLSRIAYARESERQDLDRNYLLKDSRGGELFAYIVDNNEGSQKLFISLGWQHVASADWVSFTSKRTSFMNNG